MPAQAQVKEVADVLRDIKNWVAVFAQEYSLPEEAVKTLHKKLDELGTSLRGVTCK
jgi:hypothetical protein